jgi:hypothetical protein
MTMLLKNTLLMLCRSQLHGMIPAGKPIPIFPESGEHIPQDIRDNSDVAVFRVCESGEMGGRHIQKGDLIVVERRSETRPGEMTIFKGSDGEMSLGFAEDEPDQADAAESSPFCHEDESAQQGQESSHVRDAEGGWIFGVVTGIFRKVS